MSNKIKPGLGSLVILLEPLGKIAKETVAEILDYRHKIKLLEAEQKRKINENKLKENQIDASLKFALKSLNERKIQLEKSFNIISKDLEQQHIERSKIIMSVSNLNNAIINKDYSFEDRQLFQTSLIEMSNLLKSMGEQSTSKLSLIAQNTQKALEAATIKGYLN